MDNQNKKTSNTPPKCDHNGTGFSDSDDLMELHFDAEMSEGNQLHFFVQCDDCGQKMRVNCTITSIKEEETKKEEK